MNTKLRRLAAALSLMAALPSLAADFGARLEQLLAIQPPPLFVVLQPNGMVEVSPNVQQMADEMPARIKKESADALWFDVLVLVASPVSPTKAAVMFEFKTRCAVAAAAGYEQQRDSQNLMLSAMSTLVRLARDQRLSPQWGALCVAADDATAAGYRRVMQFPPIGFQAMATSRLVYMTNINSSLMFVF